MTALSGKVLRIHQEDLCQSLGLPPHQKYQQEGGPSAADAINCIRTWSTTPVLDLTHFLDLLVFNVLIGNADAHGKNFSWLYQNGARRIAPAYDFVATTLWPELSSRLAMRVGQAKFVAEVNLDHFLKFAESTRIGKTRFRARIRELAMRVDQNLDETLNRAPSLGPDHADLLRTGIRERVRKLS
ncbi:MAG: HipA domain-containing protein [Verrucomicrobia bacterium]|nr:HipA domain-containing protein [Verrucomicrobiota bacterium]MCH8512477.1 HipA domain-containing protein [Kiritimatiellia bacterium]